MVSLSIAVRRMRVNASFTVMAGRSETYSTVMMLPALSFGYFKISFT